MTAGENLLEILSSKPGASVGKIAHGLPEEWLNCEAIQKPLHCKTFRNRMNFQFYFKEIDCRGSTISLFQNCCNGFKLIENSAVRRMVLHYRKLNRVLKEATTKTT